VKFVLKPEMLAGVPVLNHWLEGPFSKEEITQFYLFATVAVVGTLCTAWFFFTTLFYDRSPEEYKASVEEFFERLRTPVESRKSEEARENQAVAGSIGKLCMVYGGFVTLLVLIPNSPGGRLCFVACGGFMVLCGAFLSWFYRTDKPPVLSGIDETDTTPRRDL
jgi:hypothetical protein